MNVGRSEDLVMLYVYPADAGHDYGTIESRGFRKLVVERDGKPALIDNPRWTLPDARNSQPASGR